jgi:3-hydroxyacyl-[acyl-carrier-protein] dehydratase
MEAGANVFIISNSAHTAGQIITHLKLNKQSEIFEGHFPGQPVVPGACMLQLVKDVLADNFNNSFRLEKADNLKFISMIVPQENQDISLNIAYKPAENNRLTVVAKLMDGDKICFKFQGVFIRL